jgi:hypothetical protein
VTALVADGASRERLAAAGVGWVVAESGSPALNLPVAYRDGDLTLYRVGGTAPTASGRGLLIGAHLVWLGLLVGAGMVSARAQRSHRLRFKRDSLHDDRSST